MTIYRVLVSLEIEADNEDDAAREAMVIDPTMVIEAITGIGAGKSMTKPILDIRFTGKRVTVDFAQNNPRSGPGSTRYDVTVDDRTILINLFPEEVMRWLGKMINK